MLDVARIDTSLETKRRDLMAKIRQGYALVTTLKDRHVLIGDKIEEATAGIRRLEEQLAATEAVMELFYREGLFLSADPLAAPPAPRDTAPASFTLQSPKAEPFRPGHFLRCLVGGHDMVASRSMSGRATCRRCRIRRAI